MWLKAILHFCNKKLFSLSLKFLNNKKFLRFCRKPKGVIKIVPNNKNSENVFEELSICSAINLSIKEIAVRVIRLKAKTAFSLMSLWVNFFFCSVIFFEIVIKDFKIRGVIVNNDITIRFSTERISLESNFSRLNSNKNNTTLGVCKIN